MRTLVGNKEPRGMRDLFCGFTNSFIYKNLLQILLELRTLNSEPGLSKGLGFRG